MLTLFLINKSFQLWKKPQGKTVKEEEKNRDNYKNNQETNNKQTNKLSDKIPDQSSSKLSRYQNPATSEDRKSTRLNSSH